MNAILNSAQVNRVRVVATARMATVLILAATAALAVMSLIPNNERAVAQPQVQPPKATAPLSVPPVSRQAGSFAFGYLEFDWDPSASGGVPGFDSWPPASQR